MAEHASKDGNVDVIICFAVEAGPDEVQTILAGSDVAVKSNLEAIGVVLGRMNPKNFKKLQANPLVISVDQDAEVGAAPPDAEIW